MPGIAPRGNVARFAPVRSTAQKYIAGTTCAKAEGRAKPNPWDEKDEDAGILLGMF
jgi:hypothetical protein